MSSDTCPKYFTNIGGNCYHYEPSELNTWKQAKHYCEVFRDATLVQIETLEKWLGIQSYLSKGSYTKHKIGVSTLFPYVATDSHGCVTFVN